MPENTDTTLTYTVEFDGEDDQAKSEFLQSQKHGMILLQLEMAKNDGRIVGFHFA